MKPPLLQHQIELAIPPSGVHLQGDRLLWDWPSDGQNWLQRKPRQAMLDEFLRLADDKDGSEIESFAQRWGVLNWPGAPASRPVEEPLERWRDRSRQSAAIIEIASNLAANSIAPPEPWQQAAPASMVLPHEITGGVTEIVWELMSQSVVQELEQAGDEEVIDIYGQHLQRLERRRAFDPTRSKTVPVPALKLKVARRTLSEIVNWWLEDGQVLHGMSWGDAAPQPLWRGRGVRAALAFYLVSRITESKLDLIPCSHCGNWHGFQRRPKPGNANYCDDCHKRGIPERVRKQRWRDSRASTRGDSQ